MVLVIGAAILHQGRLLAARRAAPPDLAGGWELPGGKVERGEDPDTAVVREVREELGCGIEVTSYLAGEQPIRDGYTLRVALARLTDGEPIPAEGEHDAVRWLGAHELGEVDWLAPDLPFLSELRRTLESDARRFGTEVDATPRTRRASAPTPPSVQEQR